MRIHFLGIGGVGMAGVAFLLSKAGHRVSGCDKYASARTQWLKANGIAVEIGHNPAHVTPDLDELVVTPAVPADEPELVAAQTAGVRVRYRGEVLAELVNARESIAVCGSHGKTTTATFTAKLLAALGDDPAWCIGGECGAWPVAGCGSGPLVVEADESDGTLAHYRARTLVITNIDYDHPEHFKTEAAYRACFETAAAQAQNVIRSAELPPAEDALAQLVTGAHNVQNARAAIEVALRRGHSPAAIRAALPNVLSELPDRRFQLVARAADVRVYTDYAHHPREIACALGMARASAARRVRVLFQPHRYSRTAVLLNGFPPALAAADEVVLIPVYAAFEKPIPGGDIADLYAACRPGIRNLRLARSTREAWRHACLTRKPGDLILLLGAGDLISILPEVRRDLSPTTNQLPTATFLIGAGSNTWKSDLATDTVYRRTLEPAGKPGATLGIPWMAGIPGTIGGWIKMNAGAFGHSISEVVRRVKIDGTWHAAADCGFGYRTSTITGEIQDAEWDFPPAWNESPADYLKRRPPFPPGTKGSVFKNPPGDHAGRLLEEAGSKNLRVGGAYVWERHANVIVAGPDATASDFLALARLMARAVYFRFGIRLEPEVCGLGVW